MATVTGLTSERMLEIEAASVVDGDVVGGNLILTKHDGSTINAGSVVGPVGPEGPVGSDLEVLTGQTIFDVGMPDQVRAGREFMNMDFEHLGLSPPAGLWNFSDLEDMSGNGRDLTMKGSVPFAVGINGLANTAIQFSGNLANALYIPDTGAADPFRIRVGSIACWFRSAKQATVQALITKRSAAAGQYGYWLRITTANVLTFGLSTTGSDALEINSLSKLCDDRWHFVVAVFDGNIQRLYVDGVLEASQLRNGLIFPSSAPLNIGSAAVDASTAGAEPHSGRIDEGFVTSEILTEDRIRNLFCAKVPHTLGVIPARALLTVHPSCKGASLLPGDFPTTPLRLYNFSDASLANEGSNPTVALTNVGSAVSVSGVDGTKGNAFGFNGSNQRLTADDTGLPTGLAPVSFGCWVKTAKADATMYILNYGLSTTTDNKLHIISGLINFASGADVKAGPFIADGNWHFVVVVHDDTAVDGVKRKLYVDGRLVASSLVLNPVSLGGPAKFVVGATIASASHLAGQVDTVFVSNLALTMPQMMNLFMKTLHDHMPSPKNAGSHIEAMTEDHLLVAFDTLDISHRVNVKVAA